MSQEIKVQISVKEYINLLESQAKLEALEGAGVDNWEGYDLAMEYMEEIDEKKVLDLARGKV